jgi:hypothetical protein
MNVSTLQSLVLDMDVPSPHGLEPYLDVPTPQGPGAATGLVYNTGA